MRGYRTTLAALLLAASIPAAALAQAHDPPAALNAMPLIDNESVQVLRLRIDAHAKTPMHDVMPRVVVWLSEAHFLDTYADGHTQEERRKIGDVEWVSARRHAGANLADTPMEFIAIIPKTSGDMPHRH